jgi:transposase
MKRYDETFKQVAIRLAVSGTKTIAQTARDLGIKESLLYSWISKVKKSKTPVASDEFKNASDLIDELNRLRKENSRLKEEREILKKAAAFFAKEGEKR